MTAAPTMGMSIRNAGRPSRHDAGPSPSPSSDWWQQQARQLTQKIDQELFLHQSGVYANWAEQGAQGPKADDFSLNTQHRVLNSAAASSSGYLNQLASFSEAVDDWYLRFGNVANELGSTSSGSRSSAAYTDNLAYNATALDTGGFSRFYDDNGGNLIAHLESWRVNGKPIHLRRAKGVFDFMLTGEDTTGGGGCYQHEADADPSYPGHRQAKITTATIQTVMGALLLQKLAGGPPARFYLDPAQRLYTWLAGTLQDTDGLFFQNIQTGPGTYTNGSGQVIAVNSGDIVPIKLTHNAGYPVIANLLFYDLAGTQSYLDEAVRIGRAAVAHWVDPTTGGLVGHENAEVDVWGRYAYKLIDGWMDLYGHTKDSYWLDTAQRVLLWVNANVRDTAGHYPKSWGAPQAQRLNQWALIDQSAVARSCWRLASAGTAVDS